MNLSVKARIAVAMTALVVVNGMAAAATWVSLTRAAEFSQRANQAVAEAAQVQQASERITMFVSNAGALALSVSQAESPEQASAAYGELLGSESIDPLLAKLTSDSSDDELASEAQKRWDDLRTGSYSWINAEALEGGSPLRITLMPNGHYRASVRTNIEAPDWLVGLTRDQVRREIRARSAALRDATLLTMVRKADARADAARMAEEAARDRAFATTVTFMLLSLVVAVASATWLYRTIVRPLTIARSYADQVASGDLTATYGEHSNDEIGTLTRAIANMKDAVVLRIAVMREMAGAILVTAEEVDEAAKHAMAEAADSGQEARDVSEGESSADKIQRDLGVVVERAGIMTMLAAQMLEE